MLFCTISNTRECVICKQMIGSASWPAGPASDLGYCGLDRGSVRAWLWCDSKVHVGRLKKPEQTAYKGI